MHALRALIPAAPVPLLATVVACVLLAPAGALADPGTAGDQRRAAQDRSPAEPPAPRSLPSPFRPAPPEADRGAGAIGRSAASPPRAQTLTDGWEFRLGASYEADASDWEQVSVPHVMDGRPLASSFPGTVGWYRLRFQAPAAPSGYDFALAFGEVRRKATVYLNGRQIGSSDDPYTPFTVGATGLRKGAENELTVRVDNTKGPEVRDGWWNWGGIVRPVALMPRGGVALSALGLIPQLTERRDAATLRVDALVANHTTRAVTPSMLVTLTSPAGTVTRKRYRLPSLAARRSRQELLEVPVKGRPELWSPTKPQLYSARVSTTTASGTEQIDTRRIGMRRLEVRSGRLYLNGRAVQLRGAALHEDAPDRGAALTDDDVERIVSELQDVGANVTRTHYLFDERLLTRFDEEGILVWNEAPIYHRERPLKSIAGRRDALAQLERTIVGARNHPSVFANSVGNELANEPDKRVTTKRYLEAAATLARRLDPTVPVALAIRSKPGTPRQRTYKGFDLLGFNHYLGWYPCPPSAPTSLSQLGPWIDTLRRQYPDKALMMTEFGAEANHDGPAAEKGTYAYQTGFIRRTLDVVDDKPFLAGAVYWTLRDFAVRPKWDGGTCDTPTENDTIFNKGLLGYDDAATPKPAWSLVRDRFRATPLYAPRGR